MKRLLCIIIILWICNQIIYPQENNSFGIKLGLSISKIKYNAKGDVDYIYPPSKYYGSNSFNPMISMFYNYNINTNLNIESELSYIQKGSRYTYKDYYTTGVDIRYLELGINIKPTINISSIPMYMIIGPTMNYRLNVTNLEYDFVKKIMFGYNIGIGAEIKDIIKTPILVEVKYIGDFTYFFKTVAVELKNQVFVIDLGIII